MAVCRQCTALIIFSTKVHRNLVHALAIFREAILDIFCSALPVITVNSGLSSQFTECPVGPVGSVLSCEVNGHGSNPTWAIFVTFHFQLNYSFFVGRLSPVYTIQPVVKPVVKQV